MMAKILSQHIQRMKTAAKKGTFRTQAGHAGCGLVDADCVGCGRAGTTTSGEGDAGPDGLEWQNRTTWYTNL